MQGVNPEKKVSGNKEDSIEVTAKSVQDAIAQGLSQLNLTEDQVHIDVLREGSRGIFGFGSEEAAVKLTPKDQVNASGPDITTEPAETIEDIVSSEVSASTSVTNSVQAIDEIQVPDEAEVSEGSSFSDAIEDVNVDVATQQRAVEILATLLEKMSVQAEVLLRPGHELVEPDEEPPLILDITGNDLGVLIGRKGETLRSLQFVVRQILSKELGQWVPIVVDVESYLVRRRKSLMQLAVRMADKVAMSRDKVMLEPMSAQERRIVHMQLRDREDIYTQSIGDNERRKVVIYPRQS